MKKICFVVSSPMSAVAFLTPHLRAMQGSYDISVAANTQDTGLLRRYSVDLDILPVPIQRAVQPFRDIFSLLVVYRLFRRHRFDAVHSLTPKAGLLSMLAARLAGVPVRIHWFTGQVWVTKSGFRRWSLKQLDRLIAVLATHTLVDSPSQRDFLLAEGVVTDVNSEVLAEGSVCGVDAERFRPNAIARSEVREEQSIPDTAVLLLYLGRLNQDKGIADLAKAFAELASRQPELWLMLAGPDEERMEIEVSEICKGFLDRVRFVGFTDQPERFMAAADIFCLPSYREGFGSSVIEAAASGIPAVASRIYGLTDAVIEEKSGLLHTPGDHFHLVAQIERLAVDDALRKRMGRVACKRAVQDFSQSRLTDKLCAFYGKIFGS